MAASTVFAAALFGSTGCTPIGKDTVLENVSKSISAADPNLTGISVYRGGMDGFSRVLSVSVAIHELAIDAKQLSRLLSATIAAPGASEFGDLHFAVHSPDLDGAPVDLTSPAEQLGLQPVSKPVLLMMETFAHLKSRL